MYTFAAYDSVVPRYSWLFVPASMLKIDLSRHMLRRYVLDLGQRVRTQRYRRAPRLGS